MGVHLEDLPIRIDRCLNKAKYRAANSKVPGIPPEDDPLQSYPWR